MPAEKTYTITALTAQVRNADRVSVFIDGTYDFSLDVAQVVDCGVKVGRMLTEAELTELRREGEFGKLYARALEYTLMRPHSAREIRDYLQRKTLPRKYKQRKTGTLVEKPGASLLCNGCLRVLGSVVISTMGHLPSGGWRIATRVRVCRAASWRQSSVPRALHRR